MAMLFRSDLQGLTLPQLSEVAWKVADDEHALGLIRDEITDRGFGHIL